MPLFVLNNKNMQNKKRNSETYLYCQIYCGPYITSSFSIILNYSPSKNSISLNGDKLEYPLHNNALWQVWLKMTKSNGSREEVDIVNSLRTDWETNRTPDEKTTRKSSLRDSSSSELQLYLLKSLWLIKLLKFYWFLSFFFLSYW